MVSDVPLEHDLGEVVGRCGYALPLETIEQFFERFEFGSLRAPRARGRRASRRPEAAPAAVSGALVRLRAEPDVGPLAALLEKGEAAVAVEPARRGLEGNLAVAAHAGGEACLVAPADASQGRPLWRLAAHVVVHDVKAQPGFVNAPADPAFDTAVAAYLISPERPERTAGSSRSPAPTRRRSSRARRPRPPRPRAPCSRGTWPRRSGRASSSSASSGCSARSSCRWCACSRGWRPWA